ncbi:MAG: hypothetical protein Q8J64_02830 [Thermodesulfovibrionales bacterium]|nr:hypothetical protein [Thermodesulfovibrionales bacterium]
MLKVSMAVVADAANISQEGKLNICGIFNSVTVHQLPAVHPWMVLVFEIEGDRSDAHAEHKMKLDMIDADGASVLPPIEGEIKFGQVASGGTIRAPQILNIANIQFKKFGRHDIKIILNGEVMAEVPINVIEHAKQVVK